MSFLVQRSAIRGDVRAEGEYLAPNPSDTVVNAFIQRSADKLRDLLAMTDESRFLASAQVVNVVSGTDSYALDAAFLKLVDVLRQDTSLKTGWVKMDRIELAETYLEDADPGKADEARYYLRGGNLRIWPPPTWAGTVHVLYIDRQAAMTQDTDTVECGSGSGYEWLIYDVLVKCANRAGELVRAASFAKDRDTARKLLLASPKVDHARARRAVVISEPKTRRPGFRSRGV